MAAYLLDTNICVYLINRREPYWQNIAARLTAVDEARVVLSALTVGELSFGVANSRHPGRNQAALDTFLADFEVIAFDANAAREYGKLRAALEKKGQPIGAVDTLIAAHALSEGTTVVTHNTKEFSRVPGLRLTDWTKPL